MENPAENDRPPVIGRAKTVVVTPGSGENPVGVVSEIVARVSSEDEADRLVFRGPVKFESRSKHQLNSTVLPVVDRISDYLDVPRKNYEVSVVNLGATASAGIGIEISGFSADLPMLLALLSSSLQIGLRQDVVSTGHVASLDGDVAPVRSIPTKIEAVLALPGISAFVLPEHEKDKSLELLTPFEYQSAKESLLRHKGHIKIYPIGGVHDAIRIFMSDESIVFGSLRAEFFRVKATVTDSGGPVNSSVALLNEQNEKRFWDVLEHSLLNRGVEKARLLLQTFVDFHVRNLHYPENFGEKLFRLATSLPPSTRKIDDTFPLLSTELCINLSQHAKRGDHYDVRQLYKAASGEGIGVLPSLEELTETTYARKGGKEDDLIERFLAELSEENLAREIGLPLDEARASYVMNTVTVKNGFEFDDTITAFYAHMFRHIGSPAGHMNRAALSANAIELVEDAFKHKGDYNAALSEGVYGTNGGMRFVFDAMTEFLKQDRTEKHITRVFKVIIDPLDFDTRVKLMEVFMERIRPELPDELKDLPPKDLAPHWVTIVQHYAKFKANVSELLKRL